MTPRTPKPKPVEAWAVLSEDGTSIVQTRSHAGHLMPAVFTRCINATGFYSPEGNPLPYQLVRIIPVTRKPRTKRKTRRKQ